ncbi:hypothetical protein MTBBW1_800008 [Desulfamplus magnetovallimortis]|uniref:Uncharacterized protein n=1 Tax=Desulfamplus magnetovallimortis TaxID=1246637 RepID=A0A1W1HKA3_9BACT|nr:hypothetical protein MTBBW1_800008 [Desulfamplus magnetovallimortis]
MCLSPFSCFFKPILGNKALKIKTVQQCSAVPPVADTEERTRSKKVSKVGSVLFCNQNEKLELS